MISKLLVLTWPRLFVFECQLELQSSVFTDYWLVFMAAGSTHNSLFLWPSITVCLPNLRLCSKMVYILILMIKFQFSFLPCVCNCYASLFIKLAKIDVDFFSYIHTEFYLLKWGLREVGFQKVPVSTAICHWMPFLNFSKLKKALNNMLHQILSWAKNVP